MNLKIAKNKYWRKSTHTLRMWLCVNLCMYGGFCVYVCVCGGFCVYVCDLRKDEEQSKTYLCVCVCVCVRVCVQITTYAKSAIFTNVTIVSNILCLFTCVEHANFLWFFRAFLVIFKKVFSLNSFSITLKVILLENLNKKRYFYCKFKIKCLS